ncbi:MAG: DNA-binding protein [Bordetella sp.]|uniref:DNA-binding protein n=1 Tax=Bordetella sp. TaxID=28081 RepID=UPI003F7C47CD
MSTIQFIPEGLAAVANGRDTLTTNEAAPMINREPETMYKWSSCGNGPIRPVRINGRLAWRVIDLARLLSGESAA